MMSVLFVSCMLEQHLWKFLNYVLSSVMECRWAVYLKLWFGITEQEDASGDADEDEEDEDGDARYMFRVPQPDPSIDTSRVEEIPAKEPKFHAVPLKSALKKKSSSGGGSGPGTPQNTPTQESRPLAVRQEHHASFKWVQVKSIVNKIISSCATLLSFICLKFTRSWKCPKTGLSSICI